MKIEALTQVFD